ncbi:MAG: hypothetical protein WCK58_04325 [Chloroflexota bacterium]
MPTAFASLRVRLARPVIANALLATAVLLVALPWIAALVVDASRVAWLVGIDARIYFTATDSWLADGSWYLPRQLHGPYSIEYGDVLYPPVLLYLLLPFRILPMPLWWLIPLTAIAVALGRIRPPRWSWPLLVLCLAYPSGTEQVIKGNPVIWIVAAVAVALATGRPTTLALLKPSLFPFALIGIRRREWWLTLAVLGLASLPVISLTLLYPQVILDSRGGGLLYSARDVPLVCLPLFAWLAAGRGRRPTSGAPAAP